MSAENSEVSSDSEIEVIDLSKQVSKLLTPLIELDLYRVVAEWTNKKKNYRRDFLPIYRFVDRFLGLVVAVLIHYCWTDLDLTFPPSNPRKILTSDQLVTLERLMIGLCRVEDLRDIECLKEEKEKEEILNFST